MNTNPKDVLKARLAAGDIAIDEYRQLLAEISDEVTDGPRLAPKPNVLPRANIDAKRTSGPSTRAQTEDTGALIAELDDLHLFQHVIVYKNVHHPLSDVISVRGGQSARSLNLVPIQKSSSLRIQFLSGETISIAEERLLFSGKRHEAIGRLLDALRTITFNQRITNLTRKLIQQGQIALTKTYLIGGREVGEVVILRKDGTVTSPTKTVNLKVAKASGTFGLGTEWNVPGIYSHRTNPNEVVLSDKKAMLRGGVPFGALTFIPSAEDVDIVHSLLAWMVVPGNILE